MLQLDRTTLGNIVHLRADVAQWSKLPIIPSGACELGTTCDNFVVLQLLTFAAAAARREDHHLAVAHGLRIGQSEDPGRLKLRGKDLATFTDVHCRDDKDQDSPGLQPVVSVRQEHSFRTFVSTFAHGPVVWWLYERAGVCV